MPVEMPYSILDYGLTVVALIVMGVMVYLFAQFGLRHMKAVTQVTEHLVELSRDLAGEVREMAAEFHRMRDDLYRNGQIRKWREEGGKDV